MEHSDLLQHVVRALERLEIRYFVTGSTGTIFFGEPRFTNDIDVVVDLPAGKVEQLCAAFPEPDFYVSAPAARRAVASRHQFNVIHPGSGLKVDVIVAADTPFNRSRFARACRVHPADDYEASFAAPEDLILKKLEYFRLGGSEKHLRDILGVLRISGDRVDREYVRDWAIRLGVLEHWEAVLKRLAGAG